MCGIAGLIDFNKQSSPEFLEKSVKSMTDRLIYRGPDGEGQWVDAQNGVALGHRRLAIIDLSENGFQPMASHDGRFQIVYNGEVYNAAEMRTELQEKGVFFNGHSDTEVIVNGFAVWGINQTIQRLIGMFAIALWDKSEKCLYLIRDRLGIKPIYYSQTGGYFSFASEMKPFKELEWLDKSIDYNAVSAYFQLGYVPAPLSIFKQIKKLETGTILKIDQKGMVSEEKYWDVSAIAHQGVTARRTNSYEDQVDELESLISDAVKIRMISDVPLGAFLSGGVDSSCVTALMQKNSTDRIKTFSIGFHETGYNEAEHAKRVAKHIGTDHTELYVDDQMCLDVIPKLSGIYDEPFSDSSQIPTYLVSKMTRDHVTVALSGDGGDELFAGYNRHVFGHKISKMTAKYPRFLTKILGNSLSKISPHQWDNLLSPLRGRVLPDQIGDKIYKSIPLFSQDNALDMYRSILCQIDEKTASNILGDKGSFHLHHDISMDSQVFEKIQLLDMLVYLPNDILTKVDRASMAASLEARVPLLDHRIVEWSWKLPFEMKISGNTGKKILRDVLYRHVPQDLIDRPKAGFAIPLAEWLRGPLKEWSQELLFENDSFKDCGFNQKPVDELWQDHMDQKRNNAPQIWSILMFLDWFKKIT